MTIHWTQGDIFESNAKALVNPVNCVGVSGKGLALAFRRRFPHAYRCYQSACAQGEMQLGQPILIHDIPIVICFPTKQHWRDRSCLSDIRKGLRSLKILVREHKLKSIAIPALGCGLGGLSWEDVGPMMQAELTDLDIPVEVYRPR